jgi:hypothetical protein
MGFICSWPVQERKEIFVTPSSLALPALHPAIARASEAPAAKATARRARDFMVNSFIRMKSGSIQTKYAPAAEPNYIVIVQVRKTLAGDPDACQDRIITAV